MPYIAEYCGKLQDDRQLERKGCIVRNLKNRLGKVFGDEIGFLQKSNGISEVVYGTKEVHINTEASLKKAKETGRMVRNELMNLTNVYSCWPSTEDDLVKGDFEVHPLTNALLSSILSARGKETEIIIRIMNAIAQDLLYNASMGKKKTTKHVQLAISVKRKTGSVSVIRWLNRFGHATSYNEINAIETKLAEDQVRNITFRIYVPNNIQPSVFVTFVYDNCDHNAESIYNVTLHATNGIVIQRFEISVSVKTNMLLSVKIM